MIEVTRLHTDEVLFRTAAADLRGADLRRVDLRGADLVAADLREVDLRGANLSGAHLSRAKLHGGDLRGADLSEADLRRANLRKAHLREADLFAADLIAADLREVDLRGANLSRAHLVSANLRAAHLGGADLHRANLHRANLRKAHLVGANLRRAHLSEADLSEAVFAYTILAFCSDLHEAHGLVNVRHAGPSSLDAATLRDSVVHLPYTFLQGVGYTDDEIHNLQAMYCGGTVFYSCFLSHAAPDGEFADRLRVDLLNANISCWHYRFDMQGGKFWRAQINEAIKLHDKLVLICSEQSLLRANVVDEIIAAMEREREQGEQKLFPIRLDDYILGDEILRVTDERMASGLWREDWVRYVRAYHIPDLSRWKDHNAYKPEFTRLVRALKQPPSR